MMWKIEMQKLKLLCIFNDRKNCTVCINVKIKLLKFKTEKRWPNLKGQMLYWWIKKYDIYMINNDEIINKFLLVSEKFMPSVYLKKPRVMARSYKQFAKNQWRRQNIMKQEIINKFIEMN